MAITKVYITGVTGFIGRFLAEYLHGHGYDAVGVSRQAGVLASVPVISYGQLLVQAEEGEMAGACIVHCAGRAHVMKESEANPEKAYYDANVGLTQRVLDIARKGKVSQIVFLSTVKVNGEGCGQPYRAEDKPAPVGVYGQTKREAEQLLLAYANESLKVSVLRLPLVYGPGAKGNLALLDKIILRRVPLPFAGFSNKRDMISIKNLSSVIRFFIEHSPGVSKVWMVSDGQALSTPQVCRYMAKARNIPLKLFWLPAPLLKFMLRTLGKEGVFQRLFGSFQVDSEPLTQLGWVPEQSSEEGFLDMFAAERPVC